MAILQCTDDLKAYCLRKLGEPCINIEVDTTQADDRVDDAMQLFCQRHFDGTEEVWEKYTLTAGDISRGYKTIRDDIVAVVDLVTMATTSSEKWTDLTYQFKLNQLVNFTVPDISYFKLSMSHINLVRQTLTPTRTFTFNKATHQLAIQGSLVPGNFFVIHGYRVIDPEDFPDVYNDEWIKTYTTALIKQQWGSNLKKFSGVQMPGGITLNGQTIYDEATEELAKLLEEFSLRYELPVSMFFCQEIKSNHVTSDHFL